MNKRIFALLSLPIVGFIVFLVVHFSFLQIINTAKLQNENLRSKEVISTDINSEIFKIKSLFYQFPL
ncbi:MAG: hypothetical protein GXO40_05880, partial [Epsilonproteobacteria bacterium]|nr:hypothetical protein [Campylobacterota bacterium]